MVKNYPDILKDANSKAKWNRDIEYIRKNSADYFEFDPSGTYYYRNKEFDEIISKYPDTDAAEVCRFEKVLEKHFGEWELTSEPALRELKDIKELVKTYPYIKNRDYLIERLAYIYWYIQLTIDLSKDEKNKYLEEAKQYYKENRKRIDNLRNAESVRSLLELIKNK